ncbi:MAG: alpha/beta hydrolase [Ruminococcus sp.]|nr:alpha/beta hydrolase [Ruminococcus sp.]
MEKRITLWMQEEYHFPKAGKFIPFLMAHLHDDEAVRPAMLVIPGGGFILPSSGEADGVADKFYHMGYNTFVFVYTNNVTLDNPMVHQALRDASRAVKTIRARSEEFHVDPNRIFGIGFSGGGYMAAALATLYDSPEMSGDVKYPEVSNQLDAAVLVYALVSGEKYTCPGAFDRLLGEGASTEDVETYSLNTRVKNNSVPMYIMHGSADVMCPPNNALLMAEACTKEDVPFELHLYLGCNHVFTCAALDPRFTVSSQYVYEQLYYTIEATSEEEFSGYGELFANLRQGMNYGEFAKVVTEETMMKLWMTGLHVDFAKLQEAMGATAGNASYTMNPNPNTDAWWLGVDRWIKMIMRESTNE